MANEVSEPIRGGAVARSKLFDGMARTANEALAAGVTVSFPILSISPGKWSVRLKGVSRTIMIPGHKDVPQPWYDVVMLNAQKDMSRVYYPPAPGGGSSYAPGGHDRPDCKSHNGIKPDDDVVSPINPVCVTCPKNEWKSGGTPASPNAKACQQRRRTIVVPYGDDLTNEAEGGPMLLSVPPGSLNNQAAYRDKLTELDEPYFGLVTRLSYETEDPKSGKAITFPRIKFDVLRQADGNPWWLNDQEAEVVLRLRESEAVKRIMDSTAVDNEGPEGREDTGEGGVGGVRAPPPKGPAPIAAIPAAPTPEAPPPAPTFVAPPPPPPPKPPGGRPVSGISEAVQNPAPPPPSTRKLRAVPDTVVEDDGEAEAHAPIPGGQTSVFKNLMEIK